MFITCLVGIFLIAIVDLLPKRIEKPYNVLVVSSGMPFFSLIGHADRLCHRESC